MTDIHREASVANLADRRHLSGHGAPRPTIEPSDVEINGAKLRRLRKLNGDDLKSFAARVGVSFQYISQLERGVRRRVSPPTFARICDALGIEDRGEMVMPVAVTHGWNRVADV